MTTDDPVDALFDDDLARLIAKTHESHVHVQSGPGIPGCIPLTEGYMVKLYCKISHSCAFEDVSLAITTAHALGIRTPAIKRTIRADKGDVEVITERIHGPTLMEAWADLGIASTLRLAFQVRSMVGRMRTLTSPTAGSLGTGDCRVSWLDEYYGVPPHAPAATITAIINFWRNLKSFRKEKSKTREEHQETCAAPMSLTDDLVFTHHDLAPRNIIVEEGTGLPWLIDWDEAGYYPRYFEHVGMRNFHVPVSWGWFARLRWKLFVWIATGWRWYKKENDMLHEVKRKADRFPAARRFNIKAGVTPSVRAVED